MWGVGEEHSIRGASPKGAPRPSGKMGVREEGVAGAELWGGPGSMHKLKKKGLEAQSVPGQEEVRKGGPGRESIGGQRGQTTVRTLPVKSVGKGQADGRRVRGQGHTDTLT